MEPAYTKEIRDYQRMDYLIHETFCTNIIVITRQIIRTETEMINEENTGITVIENYQTELVL